MWLSEKTAQSADNNALSAEFATVSIGGETPSVEAGGEKRGLGIVSAGGYVWRPKAGQQVLVLKCGDEGEFVVGTMQDAQAPTLQNGEIYISAGTGGAVHIKQDGSVELTGRVNVYGELYVNGAAVTGE